MPFKLGDPADLPPWPSATLPERYLILRLRRGLTQVALAERAAVATTTVQRVEDRPAACSMDSLERVASALGTTLEGMMPASRDPDDAT